MTRIISFAVAAAIIIGTGVLHGHRTNRWGIDQVLEDATARLDHVPTKIGNWNGTDQDVGSSVLGRAEANRILARNYVNEKTGAKISTLIVCGRPGPVAVHTPDICFQGAGRKMMNNPEQMTAALNEKTENSQSVQFMTADFHRPEDAIPLRQRVHWTWSADGNWIAPKSNARGEFMWQSKLYKLYIVRTVTPDEGSEDEDAVDPSIAFAELFIPALDKALFGEKASE